MGFLKRLFSIGSKKNKKQRPQIVHNVDAKLRALEEEEHEAAVNRLLRSSSTRYTVVSEVEYSSLPPLPHPINHVIQPPAASTVSLASSTVSQRGTYNVTVHKRKQATYTPAGSNQDLDETIVPQRTPEQRYSNDMSHLLELRSHPSVASLLDMYDEHGRIPAEAFSNSPPSPKKEERVQTRRNGSTLRQLLGEPDSLSSRKSHGPGSAEGDISWAERFLGEADSILSASSVDLPTPPTHDHFGNRAPNDLSFNTDHDLSINTYENPAISSMEVELSIADSIVPVETKHVGPYKNPDPMTPQRASQVFKFLTERRTSRYVEDPERSLPELPSAFSISSDEDFPEANEGRSLFSDDALEDNPTSAHCTAIYNPSSGDVHPNSTTNYDHVQPHFSPSGVPQTPSMQVAAKVQNPAETLWEAANLRKTENLPNAPTRVIVTAPTPSGKLELPSRIPRGPRTQSKRSSTGHGKIRRASTVAERSPNSATTSRLNDLYTPLPPKRQSHRRSSSNASTSSSLRNVEIGPPTRLVEKSRRRASSSARSILTELNKENIAELQVQSILPSTPLRSKSDSRSLFRAVVTPSIFRPPPGTTPSPASSSELSPVGKQLMMNVRQQRSRARETGRQKSGRRFGFGTTKI